MKICYFLEQLDNKLKTGYLDCGVPYVCSVHLVKIWSNRLLQMKPWPLQSTTCLAYYSLIILFYIVRKRQSRS